MIKVKYEQLFPTAIYLNCRIGLETEIPDEGDAMAELEGIKSFVNEFHQKQFPQFYEQGNPTFTYKGEDELPVIQEKDR